eukprot:1033048-Amphidinium_carterae.1
MTRHHELLGDKVWALQYQADTRCRQEHMEVIRKREKAAFDLGGCTSGWTPDRPWDITWKLAVEDA